MFPPPRKISKSSLSRSLTCATLLLASGMGAVYAQKPTVTLMMSGQWKDPETGLVWMRCSLGQEWDGTGCKGNPLTLSWFDAKDYIQTYVNEKQRFGGYSNWRMPTVTELAGIRSCTEGWRYKVRQVMISELTEKGRATRMVNQDMGLYTVVVPDEKNGGTVTVAKWCDEDSRKPTIDTRAFPGTPVTGFYWSSTQGTGFSSGVWGVSVSSGSTFWYGRNYRNYVRLVRSDSDEKTVKSTRK